MKKLALFVFVVVAVLALAAPAFAAYETDTLNPDAAAHGGYSTTTNACKQCHDVHGAAAGTTVPLFRWSTKQAGCEACHKGAAALTSHKVYTQAAGIVAEHTLGATNIYDSSNEATLGANVALDCFDCHDAGVHGHDEGTAFGASGALIKSSWTTVNAYCANCHDLNDDAVTSHPLAASNGTTSFSASSTCKSCHTSTVASGFPHQSTTDYAFLGDSTVSATANLDAKCLSCHLNGVTGVGETF